VLRRNMGRARDDARLFASSFVSKEGHFLQIFGVIIERVGHMTEWDRDRMGSVIPEGLASQITRRNAYG
jgi:hypothetical protein